MAQLVTVKLSRFDSQPWGFRLQGGKDFAQPLLLQKVNGNSLAEKAGLQAGDALIRVNSEDLFNLSHKEAQNALVRAGNSFEITVQRGGSTWRPSVTPVGPAPTAPTPTIQPVTKTSLAYQGPPAQAIGSGHNTAAKPFGAAGQLNGESAKNLAGKLYNSPIGLYSEENIAETLSAQTEVLAGGVLGVNFKKNEKTYNAANSEVLKMVQEIDNEPREPEPVSVAPPSAPTTPRTVPVTNPLAGLRHVSAPETKPDVPQDPLKVLPPGQNICADCERLIVGLFVRIKDKNLHVECFKCATCGTSLKNVGYYNISNKLYCDVHAKLVASQNPPAPNLEPVTIPPGVKPLSSLIGSAMQSAPPAPSVISSVQPGTPGSPLPGTLGPLPFHAVQTGIRHVNAPRSVPFQPQTPPAAAPIQAPKLNLGQPAVCPPAPTSAPAPRPLSDSQADGGIQYQSYSTVSQSSYAAASQSTSFGASYQSDSSQQSYQSSFQSESSSSQQKKMSICSQEVGSHLDAQNVVKQLSEILEEHDRCPSPTPIDEVVDRVILSKDEKIQQIEQQQQWKQYQCGQLNENVTTQQSALSFLRSHSTPVAELEALYDQQQKEIEEHLHIIQRLGNQKRMSIDETQIRELENEIIERENVISEKVRKQQEIEKKKRVHFDIEEEKSEGGADESAAARQREEEQQREADRVQQEQERQRQEEERVRREQAVRQQDEERVRQEQAKRQQEAKARQEDEERRKHQLTVEHYREHAKTPVAELEAYDRHDGMSRKTETIYHTYEHLVQEEEEEFKEGTLRPATPCRAASPMPGSIPGAEVNLLLKNIQGINFEFELNDATRKKPEPRTFKLPDLRNLSNVKPYAPPKQDVPPPAELPRIEVPVPAIQVPILESVPVPQQPVLAPAPQPIPAPKPLPVIAQQAPIPQPQPKPILVQDAIKEQRRQVHEELALNERFRKKQERLGVEQHRVERAKTPVAEMEDELRHHESSERTHHIYDSYDKVFEVADRPRSRIGQPIPENQTISNAEKSLFFQNISGINYEFENISELTAIKHLPTEQKSLFVRDVEHRTKSPVAIGVNEYSRKPVPEWTPKPDPYQSQFVQALTTMPDPNAAASKKSYEQFRHEQEILYRQQKEMQKSYCEQQKTGLGANKAQHSSMVEALTIASDRPYSPWPAAPASQPIQPEAQPPYVPPPFVPVAEPEAVPVEQPREEPKYDGSRRRSSGFPGVNVQRTPYQMLRGSQIQSSFMEELVTQQSAISQFMSETEESVTKVHRKDTIDAAFGLMPSVSQVAYAAPPPADKRAELIASQSQFGSSVNVKTEKVVTEAKPLPRPISLTEALTIAPEDPYISLPEPAKPQATLIHGGANVALTKSVAAAEKQVNTPQPPQIEIKPIYEVRDLQLSKNAIKGEYTGFIEEEKAKSAEAGTIKGDNLTGSYQKSEESSSSFVQLEKSSVVGAPQEIKPVGFPPVSQELKEFTQISQSASAQQSSEQTEKVETIGNTVKTTKRRVVEVAESSHKEVTQIRAVGGVSIGGIDPVSGLRRTSNEVVGKSSSVSYQSSAVSGLSKPVTIPTYQNQLGEKSAEPLPAAPAGKVDVRDFQPKPRPRSVVGDKVTHPEVKVPMAFRSRTPVPLPKVEFTPKQQQPVAQPQRNLPTYNQDQVFRSASPRPIPVPKAQFGGYVGTPQQPQKTPATVYRTTSPLPIPAVNSYKPQQPQQAYLKPAQPTVFRSTSPVPVPKMVKTNESYQQPTSSWRVQPVKTEKRVSWPPKEEPVILPGEIPTSVSQMSVKEKVIQQEVQAQRNLEEVRKTSLTRKPSIDKVIPATPVAQQQTPTEPPKSVRAMVSQQEQQAKINQEEERRTSLIKTSTDRRKSEEESRVPRTSLATSKQAPTPKHDPIIAPRPFGTPTPQRRIATPHFQPITPVAITESQSATITAPKLSFSSQSSASSNLEMSKVTLTKSSASAFKPLDTIVPVKPVAFRPAPAPTLPRPPSPPASCDNGAGAGAGGPGAKGATFGGLSAPRRGRGVLNQPNAGRIALCAQCNGQIRGPFITALGKIWCPEHFVCNTPQCRRPLADIGFVEEKGGLHCEFCFEKYIAPNCDKCAQKIKGDCLNAIGKHFHPECFTCAYCGKLFGNSPFYLEDGLPYCENDWNELFTTKCFACGFPIEAGDRWVEALNNNYHSQCFNCAVCKKNLEGQSFFAKGGRPFCKAHAR